MVWRGLNRVRRGRVQGDGGLPGSFMILALDIGNTEITAGVFRSGAKDINLAFRLGTDLDKTPSEYASEFEDLLGNVGHGPGELEVAIISSVVPPLDAPVNEALSGCLGVEPLRVGVDIPFGMEVLADDPAEIGDDRLVNAVAAFSAYGGPVIVVDFGTAITFDFVTASAGFAGGVIAPGIGLSSDALSERAAKLPRVDVARPARVVGTNTLESMRSGLFWGFVGLVDGVIKRMSEEVGGVSRVVATGGLAGVISGESDYIEEVDELLTLKGLKRLYERVI
jgi:type III pantothenate kinase